MKLSEVEIRAEARLRIERALANIQEAQNQLGNACAELSALEGGVPVWKATSKLYDSAHALWYRVERFRQQGRYRLDSINVQALERRQGERK
jgi:hypothetical protein